MTFLTPQQNRRLSNPLLDGETGLDARSRLCFGFIKLVFVLEHLKRLILDLSWNEILVFIVLSSLLYTIIIALVFTLQSEPHKAYLDISKTQKH